MQGSCDGTTKYDSVQCIRCRDCAPGEYRGLGVLGAVSNSLSIPCNGSTSHDNVVCVPCGTRCSDGQYTFAVCSGSGFLDETSCKECSVCDRDYAGQYNGVYGSCNGSQVEDAVVCSLSPRENSFLGDSCAPGFFAYGRLDAIDT